MIGLNFIKFNKKLFNRFISGILSALITINLLSILSVCFIVDSAYYPDGWKDWQQSDSRWGMQIMKPGGSTIGSSGCWVSSFCKMYIQAGLIEDGDKDYDLGTFMTWAGEHGCLDGSLCITGAGMTTLLCYPDGDEPKFNKVGDRVFTTGDNKKTMQDIKKLREDGKLIIVRQADHHSILVGDPIENEDGEDDVELYDTAGTGHTILNLPESINFYDVYELADGTPVLPGEEIDSDEEDDDAVEELESAVCDSAENNAPLYRLSKYNEEQKESLAILLNKQITQYELAAMKWNMIVSQFSIPYVNNIYDTLSDDCWDDLFKNVSKTKWGQNPYLREVATEVNENFTNTIDAYIDYLKDNDDKFKEVLKLLNNKDENVYTRIYSSDMKRFATVDDLWADDVLYVKDNTTVIGDALSTSSNDEEEEEEVIDEVEIDNDEIIEGEDMEDTEESIKPSDSEVIEETSVDDEDTTEEAEIKDIERLENKKISNQAINLWDGLSKMYEISIGEQRETFKDILENSAVTTINVPIFVATDATELYNTIFVSNAMELSDNDYHKDIDTSYFESSFGKCSLYLDRWGNICAELTKGNYVLVYPSYANPMFVSTQFEEEDIAGVYYGALNTQLKKYNIKIQGASNKVPVLMTVDSSVEITVEDAVKKIAKHGADKDSFVFDGDSYFITTGLSNDEKPLTEKVYNRNNRIVDISEDSPPMYRYDTTTFAFASKPLLTMMPRETTSMDKTNWYSELKNPDSVGLFKKLSLSNLFMLVMVK